MTKTTTEKPLTYREMIGSTFAAALGVQSNANRHRDFTRGKASHFIFTGVLFTTVFVISMICFVRIVMAALI